jgi:transcriptional regulator
MRVARAAALVFAAAAVPAIVIQVALVAGAPGSQPVFGSFGQDKGPGVCSFVMAKGLGRPDDKADVLQGTLDLMVLQALASMGPLHGYGLARRIEQISDDLLKLNEGTVYASLMRLQHRRWISASWGASENNRKAKFYSITRAGRRQLARYTSNWERISGVIARLLRTAGSV